jgi:hypothetical protein
MKFGHILEQREREGPARWSGHYVAYKGLKKLLKKHKQNPTTASRLFIAQLEGEVSRLNDVVFTEQRDIASIRSEVARLGELNASSTKDRVVLESSSWRRSDELRVFVETAYETIYKAIKKHDKATGLSLMAPVLAATDRQPFMEVLRLSVPAGVSSAATTPYPVDLLHGSASGSYAEPPSPSAKGGSDAASPVAEQPVQRALQPPPSSFSWESPMQANPDIASVMVAQFEASLASAAEYASIALRIVSPELQAGTSDWHQRMAKLVAVASLARTGVAAFVSAAAGSIRQLHDLTLSHKLAMLRAVMEVVSRNLELISPDGAATYELVLQAQFALFAPFMRPDVNAPTMRRFDIVAGMRRRAGSTHQPSARLRAELGASAAPLAPEAVGLAAPDALVIETAAADQSNAGTDIPSLAVGGALLLSPEVNTSYVSDRLMRLSSGLFYHTEIATPSPAAGSIQGGTEDGDGSTAAPLLHENSRMRVLQRGQSRVLVLPRAGDSSLRSGSSRAGSARSTLGTAGQDNDNATGVHTPLPRWQQIGLAILGLAPWDNLLRSAGAADESELEDPSSRRAWTLPMVARELWRVHRPAIMRWLPTYSVRKHLFGDVVSGVTIAIVLLPQGLAYATLAGLPPVYGLYTGLPAIVYACFGSSSQAAIGPMSIPALLLASGVSSMTPVPQGRDYIDAVLSISLLSGLLLLALGVLNLGFLVRFASRPVLSGFMTASAILTIASVAKDLLGVRVARSQVLYSYVSEIALALPQTSLPTLATGCIAIALLVLLPRWKWTAKVPAPLQVVFLSIAIFATWHTLMHAPVYGAGDVPPGGAFKNPAGISLVGYVPSSIPPPSMPTLPSTSLSQVFATTFGLVLVGFVESIAVAKLYAQKHG